MPTDLNVSVVVPTYNMRQYLRGCLDSLVFQSRQPLEVIVIDAGNDGSAEIATSYGPIVQYRRQISKGLPAARNEGISVAKGNWIGFLDADDFWAPTLLERHCQALRRAPEAKLVYFRLLVVRPDGTQIPREFLPVTEMIRRLRFGNQTPPSSVLVERNALVSSGSFDESLRAAEDWDLWVKLSRRIRFAAVDEPLVHYRVLQDSMSHNAVLTMTNETMLVERLVSDVPTGFGRFAMRRRIRAMIAFRAALATRQKQDPAMWSLIAKSILYWPAPFFKTERYRVAARTVLGGLRGEYPLPAFDGTIKH